MFTVDVCGMMIIFEYIYFLRTRYPHINRIGGHRVQEAAEWIAQTHSITMAAPAPQQTATGHGESTLTTTAPPAYSEKEALGEGQAPMQPQVGGAWPQGYAVSC